MVSIECPFRFLLISAPFIADIPFHSSLRKPAQPRNT
ncbi:hypothetical protein OROGR_029802 [Orobanche gracilis]